MARPQTNKVDYFPHPVTHSKKMSYMEKKYGNDGYAVWFKILEELGNTDYHYLNLSDEVQIMFLSDRCLISEQRLIEIINDLIRLREFDSELWAEHRILFNEKFTESIKEAYKKRSNDCINKKSLLRLLESLGVNKPSKSNPKPPKSDLQGSVKPQSRVKESKLKKSILEKTPMSKIDISDLESDYPELVDYFNIANAYRQLFIKNQKQRGSPTKNQDTAKFKNYVDPIRLMIENDKVTRSQLQVVFKFLDSSHGEFWKPNILSTSKLREKFTQLIMKANGNKTGNIEKSDAELKRSASDAVDKLLGYAR